LGGHYDRRRRRQQNVGGGAAAAAAHSSTWNNVPSPLRRVYSVDPFKRQLKTLMPKAFCFQLLFPIAYREAPLLCFAYLRHPVTVI